MSTRARLRDYLASIQVIDPSVSDSPKAGASGLINDDNNSHDSPLAQFQAETTNHIDLFILYDLFLERERLIFATMNKFRAETTHLLIGFCWIPRRDF